MNIKLTPKFEHIIELFKKRQDMNRNFDEKESIELSFTIDIDFKEKLVNINLNIGTLSHCTLSGNIKDIITEQMSSFSTPLEFNEAIDKFIDTVMYDLFIEYIINTYVDDLESKYIKKDGNYHVNML